jgi:dipeptidyl aminopeptidase/acylaminoacyl peptidase
MLTRTCRVSRLAVLPLLCAVSLAQEGAVLTPHKVAGLRSVLSAAMSPDGKHVAYTVSVPRAPGKDEDGLPWTELQVYDVDTNATRPFVTGKAGVSAVKWTADGQGVAFLEKRADDKQTALYVIPLAGGEARRAVSIGSSIASYSLAPDGKRVALVASNPEPEARKKWQEKGFKQEVYEEEVRPARLWISNLFDETASPRALELAGSVAQVQWSPAGDRLAVAVAPSALVDDEMMEQRVRIVDPASGALLAQVDNSGKLGPLAWSPDGQWIGMVAAADENDPAAGRLMVAPLSGGKPLELLPGFEGHVAALAWQDASTVMYVTAQGVWSSFGRVSFRAGIPGSPELAPKQICGPGGVILTDVSLSKDGQHGAFVANAAAHPPELFTMNHGDAAPTRRSDSNPWLREQRLALQEAVRFKARDGLELEAVLIRPLNEVTGRRYPLIVNVHGGPEACQQNGWLTGYSNPGQMAAARGIAVVHVNYRGSTGRGVAFSKLSQGDPAGKEFDDLVDAVDHLVAAGLVDKAKVAVTGGSYGGYATAWCSTRYSDRFAVGVMFVGISDKVSKVGTTDIPNEEFLVHARKRPWEDWSFLLERSPITHAGECKTPLLILHGKDDPRVNPGQSRELYRHLKLRSQAPVRLVFYPGEGHGNRKACSRLDYNLRSLQWIEHYLNGPGGEPPAIDLDYAEPKPSVKDGAAAGAASTPAGR